MSAAEIQEAIRKLPPHQAKELLKRIEDQSNAPEAALPLTDAAIEKWRKRARSGFAAGMTTDQYLRLIRDGDSG